MTDTEQRALAPFHFVVEPSAVSRIAQILRDPNPIHFDPNAVRAAGLGVRPINQGPANLAYAVNMLLAAYPGYRIAEIRSRYLANVLVSDPVEALGEAEPSDGTEVRCRFRVVNGAGQDAVVGSATLVRHDPA